MKISGIYLIHCIINNKVYIGSSKDIRKRLRNHRTNLKCNRHLNEHLQSAYNLYGKESFVYSILEKCEIKDLIEKETYWVKKYNSTNNKFGFNITLPGSIPTKETDNNIKVIEKKINKVVCINKRTGEIILYDYPKEVSDIYGLTYQRVLDILSYWKVKQGRRKSYKGLIFIYEDNYDRNYNYTNHRKKREIPGSQRKITVSKGEWSKEFNSIKECCDSLDLRYNSLYHNLRHQKYEYMGYSFNLN